MTRFRCHWVDSVFLVTLVAAVSLRSPLPADEIAADKRVPLSDAIRTQCLQVIREGLRSEEFWPSMHAAEALTSAGFGDEVKEFLAPKLTSETDDQRRCGLARELIRAGDLGREYVLFGILQNLDSNGRVHAAESLYKINSIGDGRELRRAFADKENTTLCLMAAAALGQNGNRHALQYLRDQLHAENPDVAMVAAWVLGRLGNAQDIPPLRASADRIEQPLPRAFFEYALAVLGEDVGRQSLLRNLNSADDAIRTYAADAAGPARLAAAAPALRQLLDDRAVDCRIRAAQSLLTLAIEPAPQLPDDISVLAYEATKEHPRYTEGSIVELKPGELLFATTEFNETTSDFAQARIIGRTSTDGGQTWGPGRELQPNIGRLNVLGTTLRWLPKLDGEPRRLGMLYSVTHGFDNLQTFLKVSTDAGRTFGKPVLTTPHPGYNIIVSDRMTILSSGRMLLPCSYTTDIEKVNHMVCFCYFSDDGGRTWRKGSGEIDLPKRGAMEPDVVELRDGRLLMIMRNQLGNISASHSSDAGETWNSPKPLADLRAPESPATIRVIPSTGDLLLIWNDTYEPQADHGGARTPLTAAISLDDGETWQSKRQLESDDSRTYAYTSLTFVRDRAVLSYWDEDRKTGRYSSRFRSLPVSWFYDAANPSE